MENNQHIDSFFLKLNEHLSVFKNQELKEQLIVYINYLLLHDFNKLVQVLYRFDVDEQKLKILLQQNSQTDAAVLISDLLLQRQEEKLKTKKSFKSNKDIPEEDKW